MKKILLLISFLALTFLLIGCGAQETAPEAEPVVPNEEPAAEPEVKAEEPTPEPTSTDPTVKAFSITARQWEFEPSTITVNKGDTVQLTLTSVDVKHSYSISAFGVNEVLTPGATVETSFVADKVGTFTSACNVPCGKGHVGMTGKVVVLE